MAWYNPKTWGENLNKRNIQIPEKVFIEREGGYYEYSEYEPQHLENYLESLLGGHYSKQNYINLFYCLPEIFAPVNEIASRVADANWQLRKNSNDEVVYNDQYFNKLFESPNPLMNFKQFIWQSVCYELLTGANFQYINRPSTLQPTFDNIISLWNLPTSRLNIELKKNVDIYSSTSMNDLVQSYKEGQRVFEVKNVLPFVQLDIACGNNVNKFVSPLQGASIAIKNLIPVYEARNVIYVKRGALGFIVSKKTDASGTMALTPKEKQDAQDAYQANYGLQRGKNQIGVSSAPVEYIDTSMSIQELQPFEETLSNAIAIYSALRVPPHLVPSKDKSTFNNANADMKSFYSDVIIPMANKYAQSYTRFFNIDRKYVHADFSHIPILQEDRKEKADVEKILGSVWLERWNNGVCSLNDWIVSNDGIKGIGSIYEKKIFELTEDELSLVKNVLNLKGNVNTPTQNTGDQAASSSNIV
jgi:hypothetical protein